MVAPLYEKLLEYKTKDIYPFHMPGHKRQSVKLGLGEISQIDITEIDGFDNLHHSKGVIKQVQQNVRELYKTRESYLLVNGSTVGLIAAITSQCSKGSKVIVARNCHRAVYNAIMIKELIPVYLYPDRVEQVGIMGGISPKVIETLLEQNADVSAVIVTSPTYDGVISDIGEISRITKQFNTLLIVDEAHGAHLGLTQYTAEGAIKNGADMVIHSLHKTLPALTQTALLHILSNKVDTKKIEKSLSIYQTSSPSYILMASIDNCIDILSTKGEKLFESYRNNINEFRRQLSSLKHIRVVGIDIIGETFVFNYDITKLIFCVNGLNIDGNQLAKELLYDYNIQIEYSTKDYILAMTSIFDTTEGFNKLVKALINIDSNLYKINSNHHIMKKKINPTKKYNMSEVEDMKSREIGILDAVGQVSADFIVPYPPGTPLVVPGEIMDYEIINYINELIEQGIEIIGVSNNKIINIIDEEN